MQWSCRDRSSHRTHGGYHVHYNRTTPQAFDPEATSGTASGVPTPTNPTAHVSRRQKKRLSRARRRGYRDQLAQKARLSRRQLSKSAANSPGRSTTSWVPSSRPSPARPIAASSCWSSPPSSPPAPIPSPICFAASVLGPRRPQQLSPLLLPRPLVLLGAGTPPRPDGDRSLGSHGDHRIGRR